MAREVQLQISIWGAGPRLSQGSITREINSRGTEFLIPKTFQLKTKGEAKPSEDLPFD